MKIIAGVILVLAFALTYLVIAFDQLIESVQEGKG